VTDRLLDIYFMLSAGKHDNDGSEDSVGKFLSHDGRLISTRYIEKNTCTIFSICRYLNLVKNHRIITILKFCRLWGKICYFH
jgi:hypothetical protein